MPQLKGTCSTAPAATPHMCGCVGHDGDAGWGQGRRGCRGAPAHSHVAQIAPHRQRRRALAHQQLRGSGRGVSRPLGAQGGRGEGDGRGHLASWVLHVRTRIPARVVDLDEHHVVAAVARSGPLSAIIIRRLCPVRSVGEAAVLRAGDPRCSCQCPISSLQFECLGRGRRPPQGPEPLDDRCRVVFLCQPRDRVCARANG